MSQSQPLSQLSSEYDDDKMFNTHLQSSSDSDGNDESYEMNFNENKKEIKKKFIANSDAKRNNHIKLNQGADELKIHRKSNADIKTITKKTNS